MLLDSEMFNMMYQDRFQCQLSIMLCWFVCDKVQALVGNVKLYLELVVESHHQTYL